PYPGPPPRFPSHRSRSIGSPPRRALGKLVKEAKGRGLSGTNILGNLIVPMRQAVRTGSIEERMDTAAGCVRSKEGQRPQDEACGEESWVTRRWRMRRGLRRAAPSWVVGLGLGIVLGVGSVPSEARAQFGVTTGTGFGASNTATPAYSGALGSPTNTMPP